MNALAATSQRDLSDHLRRLAKSGQIRCGVPYSRAELIAAFGAPQEQAKALFTALRKCLGAVLPGIEISTTGQARRIRYVFEAIEELPPGAVTILTGDNLHHLHQLPDASFRLIYIDPPFNTGRRQSRTHMTTVRDDTAGDRTGYKGQRYRTIVHGTKAYIDTFADYLGFLAPRLEQAHRLLTSDGSLFLHLDYREVHYAKVLLDDIFGRQSFINELIWAYDYGARTKRKWSAKHDNILWYAKNPKKYVFNYRAMDRIPYMAPGLVGPKKAARGKTPTDVWWHTIVSPNGHEKTGYPTQKPLGIVRRIVKVHSNPGDALLDFFAGSGTLGQAGAELGRRVTLIDQNPEALSVMQHRLAHWLEGASEPEVRSPSGGTPASSDGASSDGEVLSSDGDVVSSDGASESKSSARSEGDVVSSDGASGSKSSARSEGDVVSSDGASESESSARSFSEAASPPEVAPLSSEGAPMSDRASVPKSSARSSSEVASPPEVAPLSSEGAPMSDRASVSKSSARSSSEVASPSEVVPVPSVSKPSDRSSSEVASPLEVAPVSSVSKPSDRSSSEVASPSEVAPVSER